MSTTPHHLGHRQRLRERLTTTPDSLAEYELLELLLTYVLPRKDTKPLAKELLRHFGSLREALHADPTRVAEIPGLGAQTLAFWRLWQECHARCATTILRERPRFTSPEQVHDLVHARLGHLTKEEFWTILVDNQNRLMDFLRICSGTVDQTAAYPREILEKALRCHASGIILVHNHPGGNPSPSPQDKRLTETVGRLSTELGIRLLDHLIVAGDETTSFRALGLL